MGPRVLLATLTLLVAAGCGDSPKVADTPITTPIAVPTPTGGESHPIDALEAAKELNFPLIPKPLRMSLAMVSEKNPGEKRYEIDQVPRGTPQQAADFYHDKLGLSVQKKGDGFDLQGQTKDGNFILMQIQSSEGKTVVGAKIIHYDKAPNRAK